MKRFIKKFFIKNSRPVQDGNFYNHICKLIGHKPHKISVYKTAFTHRSAQVKNRNGQVVNFERLEFLGDAILGSVVAIYLYHHAPSKDEGYLTKMRSKFVSRNHLNSIGNELKLTNLLITNTKSNIGDNIDGNLLEALIGAIYVDLGFDYAEAFIYKHIIKKYRSLSVVEQKITSYKSLLYEYTQKNKIHIEFRTSQNQKDKKDLVFTTKLHLDGKFIAQATASSKKTAEEEAAKLSYKKLGLEKNKN